MHTHTRVSTNRSKANKSAPLHSHSGDKMVRTSSPWKWVQRPSALPL